MKELSSNTQGLPLDLWVTMIIVGLFGGTILAIYFLPVLIFGAIAYGLYRIFRKRNQ